MLDVGFFGKPVPLAGERRRTGSTVTRLVVSRLERLADGRYEQTHWMRNRCENEVQVGARTVYVTNDFGVLVRTEDWGRAWW